MPSDRIPEVVLRWTPTGKMKRGRQKTTSRRTVMKELEEWGLTWGAALPESSGQGGLVKFDLGPYVPAGVKSLST